MSINRRKFLKFTACSSLLIPFLSAFADEKNYENLILGGGQYKDLDSGETHYVFSTLDLASGNSRQTPMTFLPHGIHAHPITPTRLAIFEKKGPGACEFDLEKQTVIRAITTEKSRYFYGHGCYSVDGKHLFSTETYLANGDGIIAIRDSKTLAYLGEFPTYGKEPHECKLIDHGKVLVITNGGGTFGHDEPTVTYVDTATHKLLRKETLTNSRLNTGHIAIASDGTLVVASAPRRGMGKDDLGGISIKPKGQTMSSIQQPLAITKRMHGEALSVVIHEPSGIAAVTHPRGNMVTLWSIKDRTIIKVIELESPRGVALSHDNTQLLISYGKQGKLTALNINTLNTDKRKDISDTLMTGSHIYNWSNKLTEILAPGPLA